MLKFRLFVFFACLLLFDMVTSAFLSPMNQHKKGLTLSSPITPTTRTAMFGRKEKSFVTETEKKVETRGMPNLSSIFIPTKDQQSLSIEIEQQFDITKEEQKIALSLAGAEFSLEQLLFPMATSIIGFFLYEVATYNGITMEDITSTVNAFQADPTGTLQSSLDGLGPIAIVYFGILYVLAELLALPATPLTLSAGYLFGFNKGSAVVLAAGTISAMIGFFIGKTFLRQYVERILEENPTFQKLDNAIGAEGFKLLVLVRLSPIFPFSLLNYTYGASSISFPTFVTGTLLGFTPSTLGYVYTGLVGKELLLGEGSQPWYVYAGGATLLFGFLKLVTDVATEILEAIDDKE